MLPAVGQLGLFWLVLARAGGIFAVAPLLSAGNVPMPLRAALSVLVAVAALPAAHAPAGGVPQQLLPFAALVVREVTVGLVIGLVARIVFFAAELAGGLCDVQVGLTLAAVADPLYGESVSVLGNWLNLLATLAFLAAGGLELLVAALAVSLRHLPLGAPAFWGGGAHTAVAALGWAFTTAVGIAAPVLAVGVVLNVFLGFIGRAMPQLNLLQLALPAQVLVALGVLLFAMPLVVGAFSHLVPETGRWLGRLWG